MEVSETSLQEFVHSLEYEESVDLAQLLYASIRSSDFFHLTCPAFPFGVVEYFLGTILRNFDRASEDNAYKKRIEVFKLLIFHPWFCIGHWKIGPSIDLCNNSGHIHLYHALLHWRGLMEYSIHCCTNKRCPHRSSVVGQASVSVREDTLPLWTTLAFSLYPISHRLAVRVLFHATINEILSDRAAYEIATFMSPLILPNSFVFESLSKSSPEISRTNREYGTSPLLPKGSVLPTPIAQGRTAQTNPLLHQNLLEEKVEGIDISQSYGTPLPIRHMEGSRRSLLPSGVTTVNNSSESTEMHSFDRSNMEISEESLKSRATRSFHLDHPSLVEYGIEILGDNTSSIEVRCRKTNTLVDKGKLLGVKNKKLYWVPNTLQHLNSHAELGTPQFVRSKLVIQHITDEDRRQSRNFNNSTERVISGATPYTQSDISGGAMQFKSVEDVNETVSELITPNDSSVGLSPLSAYESNSYLEVTQFTDYSQSVDRNFTPLPNERVKTDRKTSPWERLHEGRAETLSSFLSHRMVKGKELRSLSEALEEVAEYNAPLSFRCRLAADGLESRLLDVSGKATMPYGLYFGQRICRPWGSITEEGTILGLGEDKALWWLPDYSIGMARLALSPEQISLLVKPKIIGAAIPREYEE